MAADARVALGELAVATREVTYLNVPPGVTTIVKVTVRPVDRTGQVLDMTEDASIRHIGHLTQQQIRTIMLEIGIRSSEVAASMMKSPMGEPLAPQHNFPSGNFHSEPREVRRPGLATSAADSPSAAAGSKEMAGVDVERVQRQLLWLSRRSAQALFVASLAFCGATLVGKLQWWPVSAWVLSSIGWGTASILLTERRSG